MRHTCSTSAQRLDGAAEKRFYSKLRSGGGDTQPGLSKAPEGRRCPHALLTTWLPA